jgi:uncharacterized protein YjbI with pentapeptide repeats
LSGWNFIGQNLSSALLYSGTLTNANLSNANLSFATLTNANLSNADLSGTTLTGADFTNAIVAGTNFGWSTGFTAQQLYSTASYQARNLGGIWMIANNLSGWNFAGQDLRNAWLSGTLTNANLTNANLTSACLDYSTLTSANFASANLSNANLNTAMLTNANLTNANLSSATLNTAMLTNANLTNANLNSASFYHANLTGADLRGAQGFSTWTTTTTNAILTDGTINGLALAAGGTLLVRNYTTSLIPIHVAGTPSFDPASSLEMIFDGNPWGSTVSFDSGMSFLLAGNLDLTVTPGINESSLVGDTFKLFDWTGTTHTGAFNIIADPGCAWDTSKLYMTGEVTLLNVVPEPSTIVLLGIVALSFVAYAWRRRDAR